MDVLYFEHNNASDKYFAFSEAQNACAMICKLRNRITTIKILTGIAVERLWFNPSVRVPTIYSILTQFVNQRSKLDQATTLLARTVHLPD